MWGCREGWSGGRSPYLPPHIKAGVKNLPHPHSCLAPTLAPFPPPRQRCSWSLVLIVIPMQTPPLRLNIMHHVMLGRKLFG